MGDPVEVWYESLRAAGRCRPGSSTWYVYRRWLDDFAKTTGIGPEELARLAREEMLNPSLRDGERSLRRILNRYANALEERGVSTNTRAQALAAIKSFLIHNDVYVRFPVPTEEPMQKPPVDPDSIRALLQSLAERRTLTNVATMAFILVAKDSGLSTSTILSLTWDGGRPYHTPIREQLARGEVPVHVRVRRGKTGVVHDSFIGPEGIWGLRFLAEETGRPLRELEGPIFPLDRVLAHAVMYRYSRKLGLHITPRDLRKFFITRMKLARRPDLHPAAWDLMVERMAEHSTGRVQRVYFQLDPEVLRRHYMESYDAIRVGYPPEADAAPSNHRDDAQLSL